MSKQRRTRTVLRLPDNVLESMRYSLTAVGDETLSAVLTEVPAFAELSTRAVGPRIERTVRRTLNGFVDVVADGVSLDDSAGLAQILSLAYDVGRGEAQGGRSPDALLAAYRVGARNAWRHWSALALSRGLPGDELAVFAEVIFDYMDRVSAAGVAGHSDEQAKSGLARQRHRERLARLLLEGRTSDELMEAADRAGWTPPHSLTAVAVPTGREAAIVAFDSRTIEVAEEHLDATHRKVTVLLVPDIGSASRDAFVSLVGIDGCVIGPSRQWQGVALSVRRVLRALEMARVSTGVLDTENALLELALTADIEAMDDLRAHALKPLENLSATTRGKLQETLRAWLLNHGRREDIAADLIVHPSTVRYRIGQLRELYGDTLTDPRTILELTVALALQPVPLATGKSDVGPPP